jgi:hypothetical protein
VNSTTTTMGMHNFKKDACCQVAINLLGTQGSVLLKPSLFIQVLVHTFKTIYFSAIHGKEHICTLLCCQNWRIRIYSREWNEIAETPTAWTSPAAGTGRQGAVDGVSWGRQCEVLDFCPRV